MSQLDPKSKPACTVNEYLAFERSAEDRHYFLDGAIHAMAGEGNAHADFSVNIVGLLFNQLRGASCHARTKDTKVRSGPILSAGETALGLFSYPDILVICGEPEFHDDLKDVILNPKVIFEVLSESTGLRPRREVRTLPEVEPFGHRLRAGFSGPCTDRPLHAATDGSWSYRITAGLDASVTIASIKCTLKLAEVYERVALAEET